MQQMSDFQFLPCVDPSTGKELLNELQTIRLANERTKEPIQHLFNLLKQAKKHLYIHTYYIELLIFIKELNLKLEGAGKNKHGALPLWKLPLQHTILKVYFLSKDLTKLCLKFI